MGRGGEAPLIAKLKEMRLAAKEQGVGMQRRLTLYWVCMALSVFAGFLLVFSLLGVFSDAERRVGELLSMQQAGSAAALEVKTDELVARSIVMSEEISRSLQTSLQARGITFAELKDNPDALLEIQENLYAPLNATMLVSRCSGAFAVLDATTNTRAKTAAVSRSGVYLRAANISAQSRPGQELTYFRGIPDIARTEGVQLHNRWNLEFDSALIPGYAERMGKTVSRLAAASYWTEKIPLKDTWESVMLLCVPILDGDGRVCGLCGVEISELYFKLLYPGMSSPYGNMMTLIAPAGSDEIALDQAMLGGTDGSYLEASGSLTVERGNRYNIYTVGGQSYVGMHQSVEIADADDLPFQLITLVPTAGVHQAAAQSRARLVLVSLVILLLMIGLSLLLSRRFVRPITQSLEAIQTEQLLAGQRSGICEIDELIAFVQSKTQEHAIGKETLPPGIAVLFRDFAERIGTLTASERGILHYYIDGHEIEEIPGLAYISMATVRKHNGNLYRKLHVASRDELMLYIDLFRRCDCLDDIKK